MLPIRFVTDPGDVGDAPVIMVDGSFGPSPSAGLHLAHWPGNRTPPSLRRDLSTEIAFAFIDLDDEERAALAGGCEALVLNHHDTDGVCALFVLTRSDAARRHRDLLNDVAASGDFFEVRSERAFAIDAALRNLPGPYPSERGPSERGPMSAATGEPAGDQERLEGAIDLLGALLEDESTAPELWRDDLEALHADRRDLESALHDDLVYLDLGVWTAAVGRGSTRANAPASFDPGRRAFLGSGRHDRALLLGPGPGGTTARFVIGTRSFFDVVTAAASPRPDLEALAGALNALETDPAEGLAWRHHDPAGASPELWYGREGLPLFVEHAGPWLATSRIDAAELKRVIMDAVRDSWVVPHDDEEADGDEDIFAV